jgi:hypothetical protein
MRDFYDQFFEVYDTVSELYYVIKYNDEFRKKEIELKLKNLTNNTFFEWKAGSIKIDLFDDWMNYEADISISTDCIIRLFSFMNMAKKDIAAVKEQYDKRIAAKVQKELE